MVSSPACTVPDTGRGTSAVLLLRGVAEGILTEPARAQASVLRAHGQYSGSTTHVEPSGAGLSDVGSIPTASILICQYNCVFERRSYIDKL